MFSVVSGVKGSRVSVVEGEVHVSKDNQDHVLHPGDQIVTSPSIERARCARTSAGAAIATA